MGKRQFAEFFPIMESACFCVPNQGQCYPPDIKNWLGGIKYGRISYSGEIPHGDFKISGIWGGDIGNSRTLGYIETAELKYKISNQ